jgi:hypothetical protein
MIGLPALISMGKTTINDRQARKGRQLKIRFLWHTWHTNEFYQYIQLDANFS